MAGLYDPMKLSEHLWNNISHRSYVESSKIYNDVVSCVHKIDPTIIRFSYKGQSYFVFETKERLSFPTPLPEQCHVLMDNYLRKRTKLEEDKSVFLSCFGSLVPHIKSKQDLRNILPDTLVHKLGWTEPRTVELGDVSFQNMTPFNQYKEFILPMIDWYIGMELIL